MDETIPIAEQDSNPKIVIERATPEDAEALYEVQSQTWLDTYPNEELGITNEDIIESRGINNPDARQSKIARWRDSIAGQSDTMAIFVAKVDGKIVGYNAPRVTEDGRGRPFALYLLPSYQGLGIGRQLFQNSLDFLGDKDLWLQVASYNKKAIDFYKKFGFVESGPVKESDSVATLPSGATIPEIEMVRPRETPGNSANKSY